MEADGGWVQLVSRDGRRVLGRGRLRLRVPASAAGGLSDWTGELESLRRASGEERPLPLGEYLLRLEGSPDEFVVDVRQFHRGAAGHEIVDVACVGECELPLPLRRVGGE